MDTRVPIYKNQKLLVEAVSDFSKKQVTLEFKGGLDENTQYTSILNYLFAVKKDMAHFVFNLSKIDYVNSVGAEGWIAFIKTTQTKGMSPTLVHASEILVERANVVPNIFGMAGSKLISFEAPYFCPKCEKRTLKLLESASFRGKSLTPPPFQCETCKGALELDEVESSYFNFLKHILK